MKQLTIRYASESANYTRPVIAFDYGDRVITYPIKTTDRTQITAMLYQVEFACKNGYEIANELTETNYEKLFRKEV